MGYLDHRRKQLDQSADQKWDYINLNDFKARGCGPGFAYFWLWLLLFISVAVYALDSFTAVNLLILNKWSSKIRPGIPFQYSKWIFSGCILLSFINFAYEAWRAVRVIKRNNVAESYLDPLAVRWESIRMGSGQGWKRFLVFAELTKGQKGAEYAALFTYFSLQSWIRVLICSGPRQVINAFTFRDVYVSKLDVSDQNAGNGFLKFWEKIGALANEDYQQALMLGAMAFTFVVWVFTLIFFLTAVIIYFTFLCHWIPRADGGLVGYCERKVNSRLKKVVTAKVNRALAKGQQQLMKEEYVTVQKGDKPVLQRVATLPTLPNVGPISPDALPTMPSLQRSDTVTYSESSEGIEMTNSIGHNRPVPSRSGTGQSRAPLLDAAAEMGQGPPLSSFQPPTRRPTVQSNYSGYSGYDKGFAPPPQRGYNTSSPAPPYQAYQAYNPSSNSSSAPSAYGAESDFHAYSNDGRNSPAPSSRYSGSVAPQYEPVQPHPAAVRSATGPYPQRGPPRYAPQRNNTAPVPSRIAESDYESSYSAPPSQSYNYNQRGPGPRGYGYDAESQNDRYY
ncbi:unnamed protein product [Clonostachys rhizophaga]|uniref:Vacuolar membrane protein n=1 Tax=Clonostachys rhizophaga TaxID=160324 RepID=A0A9N9V9I8_9HYPO|nr:unnamed protein product [Clonostachys rhizophaga]